MNPSSYLPDDASSALPPLTPGGDRQEPDSSDWETVNFPGALDVDALPIQFHRHAAPLMGTANLFDPDGSLQPAEHPPVLQQLEQENATLRSQLAQLEADLSQAQIELQLEMARFYCKQAEATVDAPAPAALHQAESQIQALNEQIQGLNEQIQSLNQSLQTAQQALETQQSTLSQKESALQALTGQLDTSQQRIAQLERDCALSQQRYDEQLQLVSQAENTCQDLRMRLHRQQQQTLQFKAALEKSIETTAIATAHDTEAPTIATPETDSAATNAAAFIPKAKPVQPWSTAPRLTPVPATHAKSTGGLPNLLAKLARPPLAAGTPATEAVEDVVMMPVEPPIAPPTPSPPPPLDAASQNILEFLFPSQSVPPVAQPAPEQAAIFDLGAFIEAGEVDAVQPPSANEVLPTASVGQPDPTPTPLPGTQPAGLWADLARLIEPELAVEAPATAAVIETQAIALQPDPAATVPQSPAPEPRVFAETPLSFVIADPLPANPTPETAPVADQNPFPSFTLHSDEFSRAAAIIAIATTAPAEAVASSHSPSPILYPDRQPKKIPSMAAVDLPSFPRG